MVTRKAVGSTVQTSSSSTSTTNAAPPYPTTPTTPTVARIDTASSVYSDGWKTTTAPDLIDTDEAQRKRRDSDVSSHGTWDSDGTEQEDDAPEHEVERPEPLNVRTSQKSPQRGGGKKEQSDDLPASLRPGPAAGASGPAVSTRAQNIGEYEEVAQGNPWALESKNPYLQKSKQSSEQSPYGDSSQKIWERPLSQPPQGTWAAQTEGPPMPQAAPPAPPVELPTAHSPADELSKMSLSESSAAVTATPYETAEVLVVPEQGQHPLAPVPKAASPDPQAFPMTNPWSGNQEQSRPILPAKEALSYTGSQQSDHAPPAVPTASHMGQAEYAPPPGPPPGAAGLLLDHAEPANPPPIITRVPAMQSQDSVPETPGAKDRRQRSEHYQIKHIRWYDSAGNTGMRDSPILTQNLNGPCPLLALVNALVLSTPPGVDTALIETLRTREQVSLGLLLDAVFDELMSGRRGETAHELPDVTELYSFLLALHTGMNVNPRFVTPVTTPQGSYQDHANSPQSMQPARPTQHSLGCFEETREMRLYSTFRVPLIHGWTAPRDTPAYSAFLRSAQTFEDAQNIQFAEAELEDKMRAEGLSVQEQQALEDIQTLKSFLQTWPTQLTDYGLETISTSLQPGQIAILFRNDHFSTLYKEPRHGALMTLVTDAGYSSHDEIVWESLVDVNGAASELFSGDFRVVSHSEDVRLNQGNSGGGNEGWQTVQSRSRYHQRPSQQSQSQPVASSSAIGEVPPPLPGPRPSSQQRSDGLEIPQTEEQRKASEQEDHDLALALQLQEEEEEQQRQTEQRRRREQELSEQLLSNEEQPPAIPPRRQSGRNARGSSTNIPITGRRNNAPQGRLAVNRPADASNPDAPPSYEQSSSDRPYRPAGATAPPAQGNPLNALDALRRQQSAYAQQSSASVNNMPGSPQHGQRRSDANRLQRRQSQNVTNAGGSSAPPYTPGPVQGAATIKDTDERCVVM